VFDPLAIALVIAFNGLISKKTQGSLEEKEDVDKTYEIYGEKSSNIENIEKSTENTEFIVENAPSDSDNVEEIEFIPNLEEVPKQIPTYNPKTGGYSYQ